MTPIRLGILAIIALAIVGCSNRDERDRVSLVLGGRDQPAATEVAAQPAAASAEESPARDTTLILPDILKAESGPSITAADQLALERTTQTTLETVPIGNESSWRNPQTGTHGVIAPRRTYQKANGQYCREFTQTFVAGSIIREGLGTACRESDGTWKLAEG
jgi:surface antigen